MPLSKNARRIAVALLITTSMIVLHNWSRSQAQNSASNGTQKMIKPIKYPTTRKSDQTEVIPR